jgi:hypothetical protein
VTAATQAQATFMAMARNGAAQIVAGGVLALCVFLATDWLRGAKATAQRETTLAGMAESFAELRQDLNALRASFQAFAREERFTEADAATLELRLMRRNEHQEERILRLESWLMDNRADKPAQP